MDLGCAYGIQAYYFRNHKKYIGVACNIKNVLQTKNSKYYKKEISDFVKDFTSQNQTFVIMNYVTTFSEVINAVKKRFDNLYIFYPK